MNKENDSIAEFETEAAEEAKIMAILQYYLSLHEADEIYDMIYNFDISVKNIEDKLDDFITRSLPQ